MAQRFSHQPPNERAFLEGLRAYLAARGQRDLAAWLDGASCAVVPSSNFSANRWNALSTQVVFYVPAERLALFTGPARRALWLAADAVLPKDAGLDVEGIDLAPQLAPPPAHDPHPLNAGALGSIAVVAHDGLRFRSHAETRIYDALKRRKVLFFPNAAAVFGGLAKSETREPDFLVCQAGKWGVLEVMGEPYHANATSARGHERARHFKDHGLLVIEFYDAARCCREP